MIEITQIFLLGLTLGGVYALMASGLTLIFGVMKIVNLAHGVFMIVGAYISYLAFIHYRIDPIVSILIVMPVMFVLGIVFYRVLISRIFGTKRTGELSILLTFSMALVVEGVLGFFFTNIYRSTTPAYATRAFTFGPYYLPEGQFYATVMSVTLLAALWAYLQYTRTGNAVRATMQNRTSAQIVGVNVDRISMFVFGIGMALAGASGAMMSFLFTFYPGKHWDWLAILLSLVVLGGMGSLIGALVGAISLAIVSAYVSSYFGPTWSPVTFYLALFLILLFRPQGLMGKKAEV